MAGDNKSKLLREAEKYVLQGKLAQAVTEYLKITKNDPNDVLTLNTIGDLYLRMGKAADARKVFGQVADHYVRNNFLLKAIAVYKKILSAEPDNLEINTTMAALYVKQGQTVDARNQYLRVAELLAAAGKAHECLECYEKVVELDPMNGAVQLRLAEIHLAEGSTDKAHSYYAGAARAQAKSGDFRGACNSYRQACQINPLSLEVLKGFLEAAIQLNEVPAVLEQLNKSLQLSPETIGLKDILGKAFMAARDPKRAAEVIQDVIAQDESHYLDMMGVSRAFLEAGDPDQAALCLDPIVPTLISRRQTDKGVEAYNLILKSHPRNILTLTRLVGIYSAINNQPRHIEALDKVASYYIAERSPADALEYLQRILQIDPGSQKYQTMHKQAFTEAYPGRPYVSPTAADAKRDDVDLELTAETAGEPGKAGDKSAAAFVEIDLLLTYGMTDKALEQLHALESQDPWNIDIRRRMVSLYKEMKQPTKAADQCLILASLYLKEHDESAAERSLSEARKLAPELVGPSFDLDGFAQRHGIATERKAPKPEPAAGRLPGVNIDLSGDISDMFFKETPGVAGSGPSIPPEQEVTTDEYTHGSALVVPTESIEDKFQEVDFYIRLGFYDEAKAKLDEIAKDHPNNAELARRYRQLPEMEGGQQPQGTQGAPAVEPVSQETAPPTPPQEEFGMEQAISRILDEQEPEAAPTEAESEEAPMELELEIVSEAPEIEVVSDEPETEAASDELEFEVVSDEPEIEIVSDEPEPEAASEISEPGVVAGTTGTALVAETAATNPVVEIPRPGLVAEVSGPHAVPGMPVPDSFEGFEAPAPASPAAPVQDAETPPELEVPEDADSQVNTMFADLLDEVNSLTDRENVREEFETHFNLGTAYREMDLTEEAIKEFQEAVKAVEPRQFPKEVIQCCGMLSTCFLDKGMPRSAIRWCQTGLNVPGISSHEAMALRYDMAVAYSATGDKDRAIECYGAIFGVDPSYRDVAQRIDQLRGGSERNGS